MSDKKYIYLFQGQLGNLHKYFYLKDRDQSDAIFMAYDEPGDDVIFFPNSTWAEGRNKLLEEALKYGDYEYYIFCDDDIEFIRGSFESFEISLEKYSPGIGVPVVPRSSKTVLKLFHNSCQSALFNDEQMMAFHCDVVKDNLILPYYLDLDGIHWWATCQIQEILLQNFYRFELMQFNAIEIDNICTARYDISENGDKSFRKLVRKWISKEMGGKYIDIRNKNKKQKKIIYTTIIIYRTIIYIVRKKILKLNCSVSQTKIMNLLSESEIIIKRLL